MKKLLALLLLLFILFYEASATHIKGGHIQYKQLSRLTFEFTFIGYRDIEGVPFGQGMFDFGDGVIYGDEESELFNWDIVDVGNGTEKWSITFVHTYSSTGLSVVSYSEEFRSSGTVNIDNSVSTRFHVESMILIEPLLSPNSSPSIIHNPGLTAILGERYMASFAQEDVEGDSLAYKLTIPKQGNALEVIGYKYPDHSAFGGEENSVFTVDRFTGDLVWESPAMVGAYSIAIETEEWREINGEKIMIGRTVIDFVLTVIESTIPFINMESPFFSCIEPGEDFQDSILIKNELNHPLKFEIKTDLESLTINGLSIADWNAVAEDSVFTSSFVQIDLYLNHNEIAYYNEFHNVIFSVIGDLDGSTVIEYSTNSLVGIGCPEDILTSLISDEVVSMDIQTDGLKTVFNDSGWHEISIYSINGVLLSRAENEGQRELKINYPFINNHVYVILVRSKTKYQTQKILFSKKD